MSPMEATGPRREPTAEPEAVSFPSPPARSPAPIAFFAYKRPGHTLRALQALSKNELASSSTLHIFADGPRAQADVAERRQIDEVRSILRSSPWCGTVVIHEAAENRGLADSIVAGVTQVVEQHGRVIVLEDDLVTSPGFLRYMNEALDLYADEERVMHVSGYIWPHRETLPDTSFSRVPLCWGWGTWSRAWKYLETDSQKLFEHFESRGRWRDFDQFGGDHLKRQLVGNRDGTMKTWFVKWHASVMMQDGWVLFPGRSLVSNEGFDRSGEHCGSSGRFAHGELAGHVPVEKIPLRENKEIRKLMEHFYTPKASTSPVARFLNWAKATAPGRALHRLGVKGLCWLMPELAVVPRMARRYRLPQSPDISPSARIAVPCAIDQTKVGRHTYISTNSRISMATIGSFCSIGPNFLAGYGIHPLDGISTSPMFYSTLGQNGTTLAATDKVVERKPIQIGNDVFIGANVTVLDGVQIGDGAVIGAGAVVSKDIPPYAVAVGCPIQVIRYRFSEEIIRKLLAIRWWEFDEEGLKDVERRFGDVEGFIAAHEAKSGAGAIAGSARCT